MSSNYIPYLPSSPPPFDVVRDENDEEEDFGTFSYAMYANDVDPTDNVSFEKCTESTEPEILSSAAKDGTTACETNDSNVEYGKDVNIEKINPFHTEPSQVGSNHLCNSDRKNEIVTLEDVDKPPVSTVFNAAETSRHAGSPIFNPLQLESTNRDSATDSGLCSESAPGEGSPLPKMDSAFAAFPQDDICCANPAQYLPLHTMDVAECDSEEWADFSSANPVSGVGSDNVRLTDIAVSNTSENIVMDTSTLVDSIDYLSKLSVMPEEDSREQHVNTCNEMSITKAQKNDVEEDRMLLQNQLCFHADAMTNASFCEFQSKSLAGFFQSDFECTTNDACFSTEQSLKTAVSQESLHLPALPNSDVEVKSDSDEYDDFVCISSALTSFPEKLTDKGKPNEWLSAAPNSSHLNVQSDHITTSSGDPNLEDDTAVKHPSFEVSFDEEFGTFSSASWNLTNQISSISEQVLSSTFPSYPVQKDVNVQLLETLLLDAGNAAKLQTSVSLWANLGDIEKTDALTYQWSSSTTSKKLLKALNVDSRNLEVIPPAQFDWRSSGLANPLDASNNASALLDLDYFFTNDSTPITPVPSATWSLENELLGPASESKVPLASIKASKMSPFLEQILSSAKFTAGTLPKPKISPTLSEEAQRVLNKLPNLSFMQAKVLMFPIRNKSP